MVQGVQFRRGTTAQHSVFTGQPGEITVDTDKKVVVVHDGSALGGYELVGAASTQRITNKDINATRINVSGITTLGYTTTTSFNAQSINVSGISTLGVTTITNLTIRQINASGITTLGYTTTTSFNAQSINVSSASTVGLLTATSIGIGTTNPTSTLTVNGAIQIQQDSSSNNRLILRGNPGSLYRWNIDNFLSNSTNQFRIFKEDEATAANGVSHFIIDTDGNVLLGTASSTGTASQKLQVNSGAYVSGNLGIGTTNPTSPLHVNGNSLVVGISSANTFRARGGTPGALGVNNNGYGFFNPGDNDSGMYSSADGQLEFYSNSTEIMRITSGGNVGIGLTNAGRKFHVDGGIRNTTRNTASTQTALHINTTTGDIAETASSRRFKRNIQDYEKGLETLVQLRSVAFNFLEDDLPNAGLIAEEVHEMGLPEFVRYDADGNPYSIPYDNLSALYINAIKDLKKENDLLRSEISAIKAHLGIE